MQKSQTQAKQQGKQNTRTSVETEPTKNYPLMTRDQIPNTPFWIVGNDEHGYKITWGKYSFTSEPHKSIDEAVNWYTTHPWQITMHLIAIGFKIADDAIKGTHQPTPTPEDYQEIKKAYGDA